VGMKARVLIGMLAMALALPGVALGVNSNSKDFNNDLATGLGDAACPDSDPASEHCPIAPGAVGTLAGLTNVGRIVQGNVDFPNYKVVPTIQYQSNKGNDDYFSPVGPGREVRVCSCDNGSTIATRSMIYMCRKAAIDDAFHDGLAKYKAFVDPDPPGAGGGAEVECSGGGAAACCATITKAGGFTLRITNNDFVVGAGACGFQVHKGPADFLFVVSDDAPCKLVGVQHSTNAGNTVADDVLPETVLQVDPVNEVENNPPTGPVRTDGNVTVTVVPLSGSPQSVVVNTTGKTQDQIHNDIANALNALPVIGLNAVAGSAEQNAPLFWRALHDAKAHSDTYQRFRNGPVVRVRNAGQKLLRIELKGQPGQFLGQSGFDESLVIPTLGEWGMFALTLLLLASGYWLLRRRRAQAGT
jgi:hypothetical protein